MTQMCKKRAIEGRPGYTVTMEYVPRKRFLLERLLAAFGVGGGPETSLRGPR
jgi:hypothetical protein